MKHKITRLLTGLVAVMLIGLMVGCGAATQATTENTEDTEEDDLIVVGFSQVGAESDWRSANTESMKETFTEANGYQLIFEDGQQKQTNQITAIRSFIQQEVDYIVLAPVTETGWDTVLGEARDAGIPVIIVDRMVDVEDEDLFTCWVGSNFELEGRKVCEWLNQYTQLKGIDPADIHIADIQGNLGATAQIGRTAGLENAAEEYGWDLLTTIQGEFTQTKGREAMDTLLKTYPNINVVYCENDNEAMGAIEAIEAAGRTAGSDLAAGEIMVVSFDGVNEQARQDCQEGKISVIGECNPLHGPRVDSIIKTLEAGDTPDKYTYVDEALYSGNDEITKLSIDGAFYEVTVLGAETN